MEALEHWNLVKVNNKYTRSTSVFGFSIVDFQQVNAGLVNSKDQTCWILQIWIRKTKYPNINIQF